MPKGFSRPSKRTNFPPSESLPAIPNSGDKDCANGKPSDEDQRVKFSYFFMAGSFSRSFGIMIRLLLSNLSRDVCLSLVVR